MWRCGSVACVNQRTLAERARQSYNPSAMHALTSHFNRLQGSSKGECRGCADAAGASRPADAERLSRGRERAWSGPREGAHGTNGSKDAKGGGPARLRGDCAARAGALTTTTNRFAQPQRSGHAPPLSPSSRENVQRVGHSGSASASGYVSPPERRTARQLVPAMTASPPAATPDDQSRSGRGNSAISTLVVRLARANLVRGSRLGLHAAVAAEA